MKERESKRRRPAFDTLPGPTCESESEEELSVKMKVKVKKGDLRRRSPACDTLSGSTWPHL